MKHITWMSGLLALGLAASTSGCSKYGAYCEDWSACVGGNDMDIDYCIEDLTGDEDVASAYDCSSEYDAYWECHEGAVHCDNAHFHSGDSCSAKAQVLYDCESHASGHQSSSGSPACACTCDCPGIGQVPTGCQGNGCCGGTCTSVCNGTVISESCG